MDATVTAALTAGIGTFSTGIVSLIATLLPLAFGVLVLVIGVPFGIRFFRHTARV
jgi:hypothetical protein